MQRIIAMKTFFVVMIGAFNGFTSIAASCLQNSPNQLFVETSLGDFFDKIAILRIKQGRISDQSKLHNITNELEALVSVYVTIPRTDELDELLGQLMHVNKNLWDLEDAVRVHERSKNFDDDFVQCVTAILENNDQRACIKRTINLLGGSTIIEEKSYGHIREFNKRSTDRCSGSEKLPSLMVATPLGDVVDRITILEIKMSCINDYQKKMNINSELTALNTTLGYHVDSSLPKFMELKDTLLSINKRMWDIQDAIRAKKEKKDFDEDFTRLGRAVYEVNDRRCAIKRSINELCSSPLVEEKMYASY